MSVSALVRSIRAGARLLVAFTAVGLVAIIVAAASGVAFVRNGSAGASLSMALAAVNESIDEWRRRSKRSAVLSGELARLNDDLKYKVSAGDAVFIRTGRWVRRAKLGPSDSQAQAGLDASVIPWLRQRDVALIVWETAGYTPQPAGDLFRNAVHNFVQAILGIHVLDRADLETLSEATASRNRWEFMLTVNPLALPNATGSPVNPIAMF